MKLSLKTRRITTLILLPIVALGVYYVYKHNKPKDIYADNPLTVTYNGSTVPDPMFNLTDMKPGDTGEMCFNVENESIESFTVEMSGFPTDEEKNFSEILNIIIYDPSTLDEVFSGTLKEFFDQSPFNLGSFPASTNSNFCVSYEFPKEAGNEYQEAKVVFDIIWRSEIPEDDIPPECEHLRDQFESIIYGTEGDDYIHGNIYSNLIYALGGDDEVDASASDDCVILGPGNDVVDSEGGNDIVFGDAGNDYIETGSGNDLAFGGDGNDEFDLEGGDDIAYGGDGEDTFYAGSGNDTINGGPGNDFMDLGSGDDIAYGDEGNDEIEGHSGNDELYGGVGMDILLGGIGDDFLDGGPDWDDLDGGTDTDTCINGEAYDSCEL